MPGGTCTSPRQAASIASAGDRLQHEYSAIGHSYFLVPVLCSVASVGRSKRVRGGRPLEALVLALIAITSPSDQVHSQES